MKQFKIEWTDVRDGLSPLLRYALMQLKKMNDDNDGKFRNSKRVVDIATRDFKVNPEILYDALINLTYPRCKVELIDGHGNVGFPPAEMYFTEMRVSNFYRQIIDEHNTDFDTPLYIPLPLVFINGTSNYKTVVPSHNVGEVIDATIALIKDPTLETKDLLKCIKGPDLLVGGEIINKDDLCKIYEKGYGEIKIKVTPETLNYRWFDDAVDYCDWYELEIEENENEQIISIPYNALLFDGKSTKHMSLKEILQCHLANYNNSLTLEEICEKLENLKQLTKERLTKC